MKDAFDAEGSAAARDASIAQVEDAACAAWMARAQSALLRVLRKQPEFTTDDVWLELGLDDKPHEPRAMGAVIRAAAKAGWCTAAERTTKTARVAAHRRPLQVWISNLYCAGGDVIIGHNGVKVLL